ncbi:MAG: zf-TFIIB domain-containing protein [Nitrospirae bacterium]|nr:zf-TFIIB domain-containing protein [Nitrospirota bacterium]
MKPSEAENEYFTRIELERLRRAEEEKQKTLSEEERHKLKEIHFMCCPKCGMKLVEIRYKGVEIDECSHCEGVWLDAGELVKMLAEEKKRKIPLLSLFTAKAHPHKESARKSGSKH